jgi:hypothetical protein
MDQPSQEAALQGWFVAVPGVQPVGPYDLSALKGEL